MEWQSKIHTKIANKFDNYFTNVAQDLLKETTSFKITSINPIELSLFLKEGEPGEVWKILNSLSSKKSSDVFEISPNFIKIAAENRKIHIRVILNCSIHHGVFPRKLKTGHIRAIYENKSKTMCSNSRPISILRIISKAIGKVMHKRLCDFIKKNKILHKNQFVFQEGKWTKHAILDLYTNITKSTEKQEKPSSIIF